MLRDWTHFRSSSTSATSLHTGNIVTTHPKDAEMKTLIALITTIALGALAGCNTIEGAGQDVKATGQAVEKAANQAKP
jgi:predicted small secreted protein